MDEAQRYQQLVDTFGQETIDALSDSEYKTVVAIDREADDVLEGVDSGGAFVPESFKRVFVHRIIVDRWSDGEDTPKDVLIDDFMGLPSAHGRVDSEDND